MAGPSDPRLTRFHLGIQFAIVFLGLLATNAVRPTATYRALSLGATPFEVGLVQSAYSLLPALLAIAIGRWVDRSGETRILATSCVAMSGAGMVSAAADSLVWLAVGQSIMGLASMTMLIAGQALIANRGPIEHRDDRFAAYSTAATIGQLAGPLMAAVILSATLPEAELERLVFVAGGAATGLAALLAATLPGTKRPDGGTSRDLVTGGIREATIRVLRRPGMRPAMLVSIVVMSSIDVLAAYLPIYGEEAGLSVGLVGALLAVRAGATLVSRVFVWRLILRFGRTAVLTSSVAMAAASMAFIPTTMSTAILVILMIVGGFGLGISGPMTLAWVSNRSPRSDRATALGVRQTGNRIGLLATPIIMGAIAGSSGVAATFLAVSAGLAGAAVVAHTTALDDVSEPSFSDSGG